MQRKMRILLWVAVDTLMLNISFLMALLILCNFDLSSGDRYLHLYRQWLMPWTALKILIFYLFGMYRHIWRYSSIFELSQILLWSAVASLVFFSFTSFSLVEDQHLPRGAYPLLFVFDTILVVGSRIFWRLQAVYRGRFFQNAAESAFKRVLVVGAGEAGRLTADELRRNPELKTLPVAFVDDDPLKKGQILRGVPVAGGRREIPELVERFDVEEIVVAMPAASFQEKKAILDICSKTRCRLRTLPGFFELIGGQVSVKQLRDVEIEDLLGREPVVLDNDAVSHYLRGRTVLVTGGGGSIGSELCRQIIRFQPRRLVILDIYENNAYDIEQELRRRHPNLALDVVIGSMRDRERLEELFRYYRPEVVFHAAAHKHVPLMEKSPKEAVKNNVLGTFNVAEVAKAYGAGRFVLISTDKAVNPTNVMGASKRMCEMVIQALNEPGKTEFVAVRFGNVLGSNGSVIPLFRKQIAAGGPVTVTDPEITRFFMTIPEAAQLVIQAGAMAHGGEIFVLDMGEPVKIAELAEKLIRLSGLEPGRDIQIQYTGLRPGEKLYEELLMNEEGLGKTRHPKIFIGQPLDITEASLRQKIDRLSRALEGDEAGVRTAMQEAVPTYAPSQV